MDCVRGKINGAKKSKLAYLSAMIGKCRKHDIHFACQFIWVWFKPVAVFFFIYTSYKPDIGSIKYDIQHHILR